MNIHILTIALLANAAYANADVIDTETKRTFFTTASQCKLSIPKGNFSITKEQVRPDGSTVYYSLSNEKMLINFSFYIDTLTAQCTSGENCLEAALRNPTYKNLQGLKKYESAGFNVAEFALDVPYQGKVLKQLNVLAEKYKKGCWADIHISQFGETIPDSTALQSILGSITIE